MRVLSIDPGYGRVGVAIVEKVPRTRERLVYSGCIETKKDTLFEERLHCIGDTITKLIQKHAPDSVAIEKIFFEKNQKTAIKVAEARGVVRYIAALYALPVYEYTPLEIKAAVTGDGHGSKAQVMQMVPRLVTIEKEITFDDEFDAIAVGLTCLATVR